MELEETLATYSGQQNPKQRIKLFARYKADLRQARDEIARLKSAGAHRQTPKREPLAERNRINAH